MSTSWQDFMTAVDQMRECQKAFSRAGSPSAHALVKRCERAVDRIIAEKRAELAREIQPELLGGDT